MRHADANAVIDSPRAHHLAKIIEDPDPIASRNAARRGVVGVHRDDELWEIELAKRAGDGLRRGR